MMYSIVRRCDLVELWKFFHAWYIYMKTSSVKKWHAQIQRINDDQVE